MQGGARMCASGSTGCRAASGASDASSTCRRGENPSLVREDDWVFRGYEMQDALDAANATLSSDLDVSREVGEAGAAVPFSESELRPRLERWFHDR